VQELLYESDDVIVTLLADTPLSRPLLVDGEVVLEKGAPAIWFTFPGHMHDVGRFHTAAGLFTGLYANILMPVEIHSRREWSATDLFLDVWIGVGREPRVLDADELEHAVASGWIPAETGAAARAEATRLIALYEQGAWPPAIVNEWTLERVLRR
jgi:hypothetical protein